MTTTELAQAQRQLQAATEQLAAHYSQDRAARQAVTALGAALVAIDIAQDFINALTPRTEP